MNLTENTEKNIYDVMALKLKPEQEAYARHSLYSFSGVHQGSLSFPL